MNLIRQVLAALHAHTDVVWRESGEETLLVSCLEQDVNGAADVALIEIEAFRSGQAAQDGAASLDRLGGYSVRKLDRRGSWARRIAEDMEVGERQVFQQRAGICECRLGFAGEAHHDISAKPQVGNETDRFLNKVGVLASGIAPVHRSQDVIVAALQGHVQIRSEE